MVYKLWNSRKNNRERSNNIRRRHISLCNKKRLLQKTMDEIDNKIDNKRNQYCSDEMFLEKASISATCYVC